MAIEIRIFKAKAGVNWFKAGWELFKTQPGTFIGMHLFLATISLIAFVIPLIQIPAALAVPSFTAGFYKAMLLRQQGEKIELFDLFKPFSDKARRVMLFRLGLYQMAGGLLIAMLSSWLFQDVITVLEQSSANPELAAQQMVDAIQLSNVIVFIAALFVYLMAFAFTIPLVYFTQTNSILETMKASILVFWHNMAPIAMFHLIATGLMVVAAFLSLIPLIIFLPIIYAGFFISFQAMFLSNIVHENEPQAAANPAHDNDRFDA